MTRREFLAGSAALAAATCARGVGAEPPERPARRPNVLLLMSDEHSPRALRCAGNTEVATPSLDALAARGVRFTAAYCQNPVCVPSRAGIATGRMPSSIGVFGNSDAFAADTPTLATVLRAAGYRTTLIGKAHYKGEGEEQHHGFERPFGSPGATVNWGKWQRARLNGVEYPSSRLPQEACVATFPEEAEMDWGVTDHALRFLREPQDKPFLLVVSYRQPHFPFVAHQRYLEPALAAVRTPRVTPQMLAELPPVSRKDRAQFKIDRLTEEQTRYARAVYHAMVAFIDAQVGRVLDGLKAAGLEQDTIVGYISDHGEMAGEHGLWYKSNFFEQSASVPFLWALPGGRSGATVAAPVSNQDILPTLAAWCGAEAPPCDGASFAGLVDGSDDGAGRVALAESFHGGGPSRMLRDARWKYCCWRDGTERLYDLTDDPDEERDRSRDAALAQTKAALRERALRGWDMDALAKAFASRSRDDNDHE